MPKWLDFQKLVATIYRELEPGTTVTHDDKIMGRHSSIQRQIDVSIRATVAGQSILIIVQAKDYKDPADVNSVGEFSAVIHDVGASKGVMVCNAGFTHAAQTLAKSLGIDLCNAVDIERREWAKDIQVPVVWHQRIPILTPQLRLHLEAGDEISTNLNEWLFSGDEGKTCKSLRGRLEIKVLAVSVAGAGRHPCSCRAGRSGTCDGSWQ